MNFLSMDDQARANGVSFADHDQPESLESKYLGEPVQKSERCAQTNPLTYAGQGMAAMLVQHGTADRLVPYQQSEEFISGLQARGLGDRVTFIPLQGAGHGDPLFAADENMERVFDFLEPLLNGGRA